MDPTTRDNKGNTALIIAAGRGHAGAITALERKRHGGSHTHRNFRGKRLLLGDSAGRVKAVVALLQAGANPNFVQQVGTFAGKTPLMWAASQGKNEVLAY